LNSKDGCSDECAVEEGWTCSGVPSICSAICGDGITIIEGKEECDDKNSILNDGCSNSCKIEKDSPPYKANQTINSIQTTNAAIQGVAAVASSVGSISALITLNPSVLLLSVLS